MGIGGRKIGFYREFLKALAIIEKDARIYYLKPPSIFFGLMLPLLLYFAFSVGRPCVTEAYRLTGVVAMALFFGSSTIEAVVLPLERKSGTFDRLIAAPISLHVLVFAKMISGTLLGLLSAFILTAILVFFGPLWRWPGLIPSGISIDPLLFIITLILSAMNASSLGMLVSAQAEDVADAMMPMNFIRFAMIFFSGTFITLEETFAFMPSLEPIAHIFPLTYSVDALRQTTYGPIRPHMIFMDYIVLLTSMIIFLLFTIRSIESTLR
ncbi:ABC transporter permease [Candidatus Bathyarchaeota archaeon]|nr:ABC transporter permease [Candidatus Bathyarchaeota archaeon]